MMLMMSADPQAVTKTTKIEQACKPTATNGIEKKDRLYPDIIEATAPPVPPPYSPMNPFTLQLQAPVFEVKSWVIVLKEKELTFTHQLERLSTRLEDTINETQRNLAQQERWLIGEKVRSFLSSEEQKIGRASCRERV